MQMQRTPTYLWRWRLRLAGAPVHLRAMRQLSTSEALRGAPEILSGAGASFGEPTRSMKMVAGDAPMAPPVAAAEAPPSGLANVAPSCSPSESLAATSASLAATTERLRSALRALSEAERAKAERARRGKELSLTAKAAPDRRVGGGAPNPFPSTAAAPGDATGDRGSVLFRTTAAPGGGVAGRSGHHHDRGSGTANSASGYMNAGGSSASATTTTTVFDTEAGTNTIDIPSAATPAAASTSVSWIRNKRPKFWALVNETNATSAAERKMADAGEEEDDEDEEEVVAGSAPTAPAPRGTTMGHVPEDGASLLPAFDPTSPAAPTPMRLMAVSPTATVPVHRASAPSSPHSVSSIPAASVEGRSSGSGSADVTRSPSSERAALTVGPVTAHSVRVTSSTSPFRNRHKREVAHVLSELLSSDPSLGPLLLRQLSAESRRLLLIMGTASEYFGENYDDVAEQVKAADTDKDHSISSKEFDAWVRQMALSTSAKRRHEDELTHETRPADVEATTSTTSSALPAADAAASPTGCSFTHSAFTATTPTPTDSVTSAAETTEATRQPIDAAVDSAKTNSVRIIEVMQKDITAAASAAAGEVEAARAGEGTAASVAQPTSAAAVAGAQTTAITDTDATRSSQQASSSSKSTSISPDHISWPTYSRIVLTAIPPFLAFGMLDNTTLVLAGGAIDSAVSGSLGLSQMAAAGLGGVVSGVAGIQVHGLAERYTRATPPPLTPEQQRSASYSRATQTGNTLGMVLGLVLGMTPLLFLGSSSQVAEQEERDLNDFRREAARSHERQCRATLQEERNSRQRLQREEARRWGDLLSNFSG